MTAIKRFRTALHDLTIATEVVDAIFAGYQKISDATSKPKRAEFFRAAMPRMESLLPLETCHAVRDACACSKSGWRLKASQKIAREYDGKSIEDKLAAINQITYMGKPSLDKDGRITAQIGEKGGFECPCPVFQGEDQSIPVSKTYCYCCAGHFRFHYQIALGVELRTVDVVSSALESCSREPCRFLYEIVK